MQDNVNQETTQNLKPRVVARPYHSVSRSGISSSATKVLYRLLRSGYTAYLVGGSVRDLLLGEQPKDFAVATSARPGEVRRLFRNSRIIGRHFRIVHVIFRDEIVEVATFRASPGAPECPDDWEEAEANAEQDDAEPGRNGPLPVPADQGIYGTPANDAQRRDFTVNALFYNIADFTVIDYVGGLDDLEDRLIRTIGEPEIRFREDPVRMMRALEYGARLGFGIEAATRDAIARCRDEIGEVSSARLKKELLKTLRSGQAVPIYSAWRSEGLFERAFPGIAGDEVSRREILSAVDESVLHGFRLSSSTLISALFLDRLFFEYERLTAGERQLDRDHLRLSLARMLEPAAADLQLPDRTLHEVSEGLFTLTKMIGPPQRDSDIVKLVSSSCFDVAWGLQGLATKLGLVPADARYSWALAVKQLLLEGVKEGERPEDAIADYIAGTHRKTNRSTAHVSVQQREPRVSEAEFDAAVSAALDPMHRRITEMRETPLIGLEFVVSEGVSLSQLVDELWEMGEDSFELPVSWVNEGSPRRKTSMVRPSSDKSDFKTSPVIELCILGLFESGAVRGISGILEVVRSGAAVLWLDEPAALVVDPETELESVPGNGFKTVVTIAGYRMDES